MSEQKEPRRLGALDLSGLGSISQLMTTPAPSAAADNSPFRTLPVDEIEPDPNQPRKTFDAEKLAELADSIRSQGIIQPISVYRNDKGGYTIVSGERRWRAAKAIGLKDVPVLVRDGTSSKVQMVENLQREDLHPFDIYRAISADLDDGLTVTQLAKEYGKSKAWVSEFASVGRMAPELQDALREGRANDIYALAQLHRLHKTSPEEVIKLAASGATVTRHLVTQLAERLARDAANGSTGNDDGKTPKPSPTPAPAPNNPTGGVADNGEGMDLGGAGDPKAVPGTPAGDDSEDEGRPHTPRMPAALPVELRATYDGETYTVLYDKQRTQEGAQLVLLATDAGITLYAPLSELSLVSIRARG